MEADAVRAELGEAVHRLDRIERRAGLVAERVAAPVADGPEPEREVVLGCRNVCHPRITTTGGGPLPARLLAEHAERGLADDLVDQRRVGRVEPAAAHVAVQALQLVGP